MNAKQFSALLVELNACSEAQEWARGKSLAVVWKTCKRGDWLLWLCGKMAEKPNWPTRKEVVLAACDCVKLAFKYVPKGEERPRKCIETTRAWASGTATLTEVITAGRAATAAYAAYAYAAAYTAEAAAYTATAAYGEAAYASYAAYATGEAAATAAEAAATAAYAADAAYAAAYTAEAAAYTVVNAHTTILAKCAVLVRKRLKVQDIR